MKYTPRDASRAPLVADQPRFEEKEFEFYPAFMEGFATFCIYTVIHFCKIGGPFAAPLMFMLLVPLIGGISGGHINPAVTFLFNFLEKHHGMPISTLGRLYSYIAAQIIGCLLSGLIVEMVRDEAMLVKTELPDGMSLETACLYEFFGTLMLCVVVCHFAHPSAKRDPLLNGFVLFFFFSCTTIAFGSKSGDFVNPAVTIATGILQTAFHQDRQQLRIAIFYSCIQFVAAPIAYLLYRNFMSTALHPEVTVQENSEAFDKPLIDMSYQPATQYGLKDGGDYEYERT